MGVKNSNATLSCFNRFQLNLMMTSLVMAKAHDYISWPTVKKLCTLKFLTQELYGAGNFKPLLLQFSSDFNELS